MAPRWLTALALAWLLAGCETVRSNTWSYKPGPLVSRAPLIDKSLNVLPFDDFRENRNVNHLLLCLIPLVPYGSVDYRTPETMRMYINSMSDTGETALMGTGGGRWVFRPSEDLARAVAAEIDHAGIVREAFLGRRPSEGDLVLRGEVISTRYSGKGYLYGLSLAGMLVPLFGAPISSVHNELELRLALTRQGSRRPIWTATVREQKNARSRIFHSEPDFFYEDLLRTGLRKAIPSLEMALTAQGRSIPAAGDANRAGGRP